MPADVERFIPITVLGGYLGAGKTTLLNALLKNPDGRRLGVVVNDFGALGVDATLIEAEANGSVPIANLANGCVCCTLGDDLGATLAEMSRLKPGLDHIVIEASGVADPAATAAWGTLAPFLPGGIVVLAAADRVRQMASDRYVGGEVLRQLKGADLLILTKVELVTPEAQVETKEWLERVSEAPVIVVSNGEISSDVVLGAQLSDRERSPLDVSEAADERYERWEWRMTESIQRCSLEAFLAELPAGLLRLKGIVPVPGDDGIETLLVQVVGASISLTLVENVGVHGLEAIGVRNVFDHLRMDRSAVKYLRST